ncbi:hypothetical protein EBU71_03825 [bacterium]|nr:hypothetical protein [Candidatus Elulimicrobium humile]
MLTTDFVLEVLNNKRDGYYVELGAQHWKDGNNTYKLEKEYDWNGVSFEINKDWCKKWEEERSNPIICGDATKFNYIDYFEKNNYPKQIDYLQVDIDAGYDPYGRPVGNYASTLHGLIALPLNTYRFSLITFEHDVSIYPKALEMRDAQREILYSLGYFLLQRHTYEDWWIDPAIMDFKDFKEFLLMNAP